MKKILIVGIALVGLSLAVSAQSGQLQKLKDAFDYLDKKDFSNSLKLFRELHSQVDRTDPSFSYVASGTAESLFFMLLDVMKRNDWKGTIDLSNEFLKLLEDDASVLDPSWLGKKYWVYKDLVVAHFGLGQWDLARQYQDALYGAYQKSQLPQGIDRQYNFEKFVHNGMNVWGYESYGSPEEVGQGTSFAKHVYYVFSRDAEGNDKDPLFTLETVKVHKLTEDLPDFVLTKRVYQKDQVESETYWAFTFKDPIDYGELHRRIVEFLNGGFTPDSRSITKIPIKKTPGP
jgi:hypothetical protein